MTHNPAIKDGIFYLANGRENLDGSIRLIFDSGDDFFHIELRTDGVWNDTGIRLSAGSLELGRDLSIGAAASFIETFNEAIIDAHQKALIPHIPFDSTGTFFVHTPILDDEATVSIYSIAVSETTSTSIGISFTTDHARFVQTITHEVGTTGASAEVTYSIYAGTDNTGTLIQRKNLPASDLVAGSTLTVNFSMSSRPVYVGFNNNSNFFIELTSDSSFSLKTDISGNPLTTFLEQELAILNMITENLVYDSFLNHILDSNLNPIFLNQF